MVMVRVSIRIMFSCRQVLWADRPMHQLISSTPTIFTVVWVEQLLRCVSVCVSRQ